MSSPLADAKRAQATALRAHADALDAEANALDVSPPLGDEWVALRGAAIVPGYALRGRVVVDAARRGELVVSAGRPPRVRRSELDRWLGTRAVRVVEHAAGATPDAEYAAVVAGATRR